MDTQKTLDDIFAAARAEEPVMRREESRAVVMSAPLPTETTRSWRRLLLGIAGIVAAGAGLWLAWPEQHPELNSTVDVATRQEAPVAQSAPSSTTTEQQGSNAEQTANFKAQSPMRPISPLHSAQLQLTKQIDRLPSSQLEFGGVQTITVSEAILDSFGIQLLPGGRVHYFLSRFGKNRDSTFFMALPFDTGRHSSIARADEAPREISSALMPRMVTDHTGDVVVRSGRGEDPEIDPKLLEPLRQPNTLSKEELRAALDRVDSVRKAQRLWDINRLIPVRINAGDTSYYIFWYEPTAELLNLLPSPILVQLRLETIAGEMALYDAGQESSPQMNDLRRLHAMLDSLISRRIDKGEVMPLPEKARPGASIMETGRSTDGAISLYSISPNPNSGEFKVRFAVRDTRVIEFSVYDINGTRLQAATSGVRVKTEDSEVEVRLKKVLPPGIYLLVLSSDKGERAVQRLMIDR